MVCAFVGDLLLITEMHGELRLKFDQYAGVAVTMNRNRTINVF
jgi:hypothetical protein